MNQWKGVVFLARADKEHDPPFPVSYTNISGSDKGLQAKRQPLIVQ